MHPSAAMASIPWTAATYDEWLPWLASQGDAGLAALLADAASLSTPEALAGAQAAVLALGVRGQADAADHLLDLIGPAASRNAETQLTQLLTTARLQLLRLQRDPAALDAAESAITEAESLANATAIGGRLAAVAGYRGLIARLRGAYPEALGHFQLALERLRDYGSTPEEAAIIWNNFGLTQLELGMHEAAAESFQEALARFKPLGSIRNLASVAQNIGFIYLELGRFEEAYAYTQKAANWYAELGERRLNRLLTYTNLGAICLALGRLEEASEALIAAEGLLQDCANPQAEQYLRTNQGAVAEAYLDRALAAEDIAEAAVAFAEAKDRYEAALAISETHALVDRRWKAHLRLGILLTGQESNSLDVAWRHLEQARNGFLRQHGTLTGERERRSFLIQQRGLYGALLKNALCRGDEALAWSLAQEAKQAGWIAGLPGDFPTEPLPSLPYTHNLGLELLNVLWENDVLATHEGLIDYFVADDAVYRFTYHPGRGLQTRALSQSFTVLRTGLRQWQEQVQQYEQTPVALQQSLDLATAGWLPALSGVLLEGVEGHFGPLITTWVVCPHGVLLDVPWLALVDEAGYPFSDWVAIQLVPYFAHLEPPGTSPSADPGAPQVLLLSGDTSDLEHAAAELERIESHIADLGIAHWPEASHPDRSLDEVLRATLKSALIWHFAGHGRFDGQSPELSAIEVGGERLTVADLLSGRFRGPHLQLVVLAACETAKVRAGDASLVEGFLRALLVTGTRAILAGAWKVRDDFTAIYMDAFYGELRATGDCTRAGRAGIAAVKGAIPHSAPHPYLWAGYQLWGVPRIAPGMQHTHDDIDRAVQGDGS